jgi:hypothetical protein
MRMELSVFLKNEDWEVNSEFNIDINYKNIAQHAAVTEYTQGAESLYLARLENGKELLLMSHSVGPAGGTNWLPVDIESLDLAEAVGEGIQRSEQ